MKRFILVLLFLSFSSISYAGELSNAEKVILYENALTFIKNTHEAMTIRQRSFMKTVNNDKTLESESKEGLLERIEILKKYMESLYEFNNHTLNYVKDCMEVIK